MIGYLCFSLSFPWLISHDPDTRGTTICCRDQELRFCNSTIQEKQSTNKGSASGTLTLRLADLLRIQMFAAFQESAKRVVSLRANDIAEAHKLKDSLRSFLDLTVCWFLTDGHTQLTIRVQPKKDTVTTERIESVLEKVMIDKQESLLFTIQGSSISREIIVTAMGGRINNDSKPPTAKCFLNFSLEMRKGDVLVTRTFFIVDHYFLIPGVGDWTVRPSLFSWGSAGFAALRKMRDR